MSDKFSDMVFLVAVIGFGLAIWIFFILIMEAVKRFLF